MKNLEKTFEREDGYVEYTYTMFGNEKWTISESEGNFTVEAWFKDNVFGSIEQAISEIRCVAGTMRIRKQNHRR